MIRNARVFNDEHIPERIPHRNQEGRELSRALEPIAEGDSGEDAVFLLGPSGSGKTCVSRFVLRQLQQEAPGVETTYINCWDHSSRFAVLREVLAGLTTVSDIHRQSTPTEEVRRRIQEYDAPPYVVVLDEADMVAEEALYDLYRVNRLSMVLIANHREELMVRMDERLQSRLNISREIQFDKYHLGQLVDILEDRAKHGLEDDSVEGRQLELISDIAAGDARQAINILYQAAREATHEGMEHLSSDVIDRAVPAARSEIHERTFNRLNDDQQVLYELIEGAGEISPSRLFEEYQRQVDNPKTERTIRNYVSKMREYNLIEAEGQKRNRVYSVRE